MAGKRKPREKNPAAVALGLLGSKNLTRAQRVARAKNAIRARYAKRDAARAAAKPEAAA